MKKREGCLLHWFETLIAYPGRVSVFNIVIPAQCQVDSKYNLLFPRVREARREKKAAREEGGEQNEIRKIGLRL